MPAPFLYPGYYPGTRPIRKKFARGKGIPYEDPLMGGVDETFGFELDIPAKVKDNFEGDFKFLFSLRYDKTSDAKSGIELTDPTELEELPGTLGVGFNLLDLAQKGGQETGTKLLKSLSNSIFTFREIGVESELRRVWDPLLGLDASSSVTQAMTLNSKEFYDSWLASDPALYAGLTSASDLRAWKAATNIRTWVDKTGKVTSTTDIGSVNELRTSIRRFIGLGNSAFSRAKAFKDIEESMLDSVEVLLTHSPAGQGGSGSAAHTAALSRISSLQDLRNRSGNAGIAFLNYQDKRVGKYIPNPFLEDKKDKLEREYQKERKKFWKDLRDGRSDLAEAVSSYGDDRLIRWARATQFRKNVFEWNEYIDTIAEGNIFKNLIWVQLKKTRFKYFTPDYWAGRVINTFKTYLKEKTIYGKMFDKVLGGIHKTVLKATRKLAENKIIGFFLGGRLIQATVTKIVQSAIVALGGTGVGALPALLIAGATYLLEKVFDVFKSLARFDLEATLDEIAKQFTNFLKVALVSCGCIALPFVIIFYSFTGSIFTQFGGTTTGLGAGGSVIGTVSGNPPPGGGGPPPGGGGHPPPGGPPSTAQCFSFMQGGFTDPNGLPTSGWPADTLAKHLAAVDVIKSKGTYIDALCGAIGDLKLHWVNQQPQNCGPNDDQECLYCGWYSDGEVYFYPNCAPSSQTYINYLLAHETGHVYHSFIGIGGFSAVNDDSEFGHLPTYPVECDHLYGHVSEAEDFAETIADYVQTGIINCSGAQPFDLCGNGNYGPHCTFGGTLFD